MGSTLACLQWTIVTKKFLISAEKKIYFLPPELL